MLTKYAVTCYKTILLESTKCLCTIIIQTILKQCCKFCVLNPDWPKGLFIPPNSPLAPLQLFLTPITFPPSHHRNRSTDLRQQLFCPHHLHHLSPPPLSSSYRHTSHFPIHLLRGLRWAFLPCNVALMRQNNLPN